MNHSLQGSLSKGKAFAIIIFQPNFAKNISIVSALMQEARRHIISGLQKDILLLQGFKPANSAASNVGLDFIKHAFPNSSFPIGATHEFFCNSMEDVSASSAFIAGMVSSLMKNKGASVWITPSQKIFPPALASFGIEPEKIIFIHIKNEKQRLWAMEEALKCDSLCSVIAEVSETGFIESRRLQLAVEQSKVTGFLIRHNPKNLSTACVTRWKIKPLATAKTLLPGIGFPRWNVELLKVRNGKTGSWQMEWKKEKFHLVRQPALTTTAEGLRKIV